MKAPRLRAWNIELKHMEYPEDIFTQESIYMLLNEKDYIWMRSSNMFDKNEKEIFEGDIVLVGKDKEEIDLESFYFALSEYSLDPEDIEIIGNIYEWEDK